MEKDFSKLVGLIYAKYKSRTAFCKAWGRTPEYLSRRINGITEFDANDMIEIVDLLGIEAVEINACFLTPKVR